MNSKRHFDCPSCNRKIFIPEDLPATVAPCPHCSVNVTSPELGKVKPPKWTPKEDAQPEELKGNSKVLINSDIAVPNSSKQGESVESDLPNVRYKSSRALPFILTALAVALITACIGVFLWVKKINETAKIKEINTPKVDRVSELKERTFQNRGWKTQAAQTFHGFMQAETIVDKLDHVLKTPGIEERMKRFYAEHELSEGDLPLETYSFVSMGEENHSRGLFMMGYDRPQQFVLNQFFRPLAPLYVQMGLEAPDETLAALARVENFQEQPVRSRVFFRKTADGLKMDWDTYIQTRFRLVKDFTENPRPGKSGVFRVLILQEATAKKNDTDRGMLTYKLRDSAHEEDFIRVLMPRHSSIAQHIKKLNWVGQPENNANRRGKLATVEVTWTQGRNPQPVLNRFICWEFYGLGNLTEENVTNSL